MTLGLQVDCPREPYPLALLENVVVLALKRVPALLVEVTRSGRVWGGSCPGCSEERTSNVARVPTTSQEQGRIGECYPPLTLRTQPAFMKETYIASCVLRSKLCAARNIEYHMLSRDFVLRRQLMDMQLNWKWTLGRPWPVVANKRCELSCSYPACARVRHACLTYPPLTLVVANRRC